MANRLTVWRLSQQCHGVRKRVASVKVCPLGGPAIPWRWQQRLAHTDVQPTHPLSGHRRRVSGRSEAGEWVCPIPRAEEQRRPPTWGIRPLCCEKTRGRTQMCVSQVADRGAPARSKRRARIPFGPGPGQRPLAMGRCSALHGAYPGTHGRRAWRPRAVPPTSGDARAACGARLPDWTAKW